MPSSDSTELFDGEEGSGNFGHEDITGQVGGSGEGGENNKDIEDIKKGLYNNDKE